jgi:DNA repair protein RecO (recombination protein O)
MLHRTEGLVLRTFPFGEADLIVTYLTPDIGIVRLFAKSPRKTRSRFGSSLEPLTHARISFWGKENASLPKLTQSDIISSFQAIRDSMDHFFRVSEIVELTLHFLPERDSNINAFSLFLRTLHHFQEGSGESLVLAHYKIKLLRYVGFAPKLDCCGRCGQGGDKFYLAHSTVLCEKCASRTDTPMRIPAAVSALYRDLLTWDISKIKRIRPTEKLLNDLSGLLDIHIHYILSKPIKSKVLACSS